MRCMPNFCVNDNVQSNGDHEVHDLTEGARLGCLPQSWNQTSLGWHPDCTSAVRQARNVYTQVNGCYYCATSCHTQ